MMTRAFAPHYLHGKTWLRCEGPTVLLCGQTWPGLSLLFSHMERVSVQREGICHHDRPDNLRL